MARFPERWKSSMRGFSKVGNLLNRLENELGFAFGDDYGRADIYEKDGQLHYEIELPGVKKEDINARVEDNQLIIEGETRRQQEVKEENYMSMQRRYGRFQRRFIIPDEVADVDDIKAEFTDGILRISLPLSESIKGDVIDIDIK